MIWDCSPYQEYENRDGYHGKILIPLMVNVKLISEVLNMAVPLSSTTTPPTRILRWPDVAKRIPFSKSYAYALQAKGLFPKPIKLIKGGRAAGYLESEINDWVNARIAEARGGKY